MGGYGQKDKNRDLPVKRACRQNGLLQSLRLFLGTGTFSLGFAVFSVLTKLTKKDDDCRIMFVFCLTELTFVAYHKFYA